jgi:hypothetical protein
MSYYRNVVVDDLRSFKDCPFPQEVVYLRTSAEALTWFETNYFQCSEPAFIDNLWLDFDLGWEDCYLLEDSWGDASSSIMDHTVITTHIITMNIVMRSRLADDAKSFSRNVELAMPTMWGLDSAQIY